MSKSADGGLARFRPLGNRATPNTIDRHISLEYNARDQEISESVKMLDFRHSSLGGDEIRLLTPVSITDDRLEYQIATYHRLSTPAYTAVSYNWGDDPPTEIIFLNGQWFRIRLNLWICLYALGRCPEAPWTHLWVDAICIDQTFEWERNCQVRHMDMIYRNAINVSVWLGLPPLREVFPPELGERQNRRMNMLDAKDFAGWSSSSLKELANRPYWNRVWVIQEFLLGRDVELYCGNSEISWLCFKSLLEDQIMESPAGHFDASLKQNKEDISQWAAWPLILGRSPMQNKLTPQPLYKLLTSHCNAECKDPRDRVFALLSLVATNERRHLLRLFPDYTMSEDDVIVIALAHVRQMNQGVEGCDDTLLYAGLGLDCKVRAARLERRAQELDYLKSDFVYVR